MQALCHSVASIKDNHRQYCFLKSDNTFNYHSKMCQIWCISIFVILIISKCISDIDNDTSLWMCHDNWYLIIISCIMIHVSLILPNTAVSKTAKSDIKLVDLTDDRKVDGEMENDDALSDVTTSARLHRDVTDNVWRLCQKQHWSAAAAGTVPVHQRLEL